MSNVADTGPKGGLSRLYQISANAQAEERGKKKKLDGEVSALNELKTKLESLKTAIGAMDESSDFMDRQASVSVVDSPVLSAKAEAGTLQGDYKFEVIQLATESRRVGASNVGEKISTTGDVSGVTLSTMKIASVITEGTVTINGAQVSIASTDSLQDVFDAISTATSGVVTAVYNATEDKIELSGSANVTLGSAADSSNFLVAMKLYANGTTSVASESRLGATNLSSAISSANLATTPITGSFSVNGVSFSYDVDADSIASIIQRINASTAGVNVLYDPINDQFSINNTVEGNFDIAVEDTSGNLLEALGLNSTSTLNTGTNARFRLNDGSTLTSNSNTFSSSVHGITGLTVTALKSGLSDTVTVSQNPENSKSKIKTLIEKYNDVQSYISKNSKLNKATDGSPTSKGVFFGNQEVSRISRDLRRMVYDSVDGMSGSIKRLADLGIDFKTDTSEIEIKNSDTLDAALKDNASIVSILFTDSADGFAQNLKTFIDNNTSSTSPIESKKKSLDSQGKAIEARITKLREELERTKKTIEENAATIEMAQADMERQIRMLQGLSRPMI